MEQVSEATGINISLLSRFESGKKLPTKSQLDVLVEIYEMDRKQALIAWLGAKIVKDYANEEYFTQALQVAEAKGEYLSASKVHSLSIFDELNTIKADLDVLRPVSDEQLTKLLESYKIEYTYESNRIEATPLLCKRQPW